ncbi:MAG TPA: saccharopine dehydrogenase C-terminal domain-containing protein [Chitinophagales bacterium]|nr:saccharopine dehydrogenase C-terminal domain-containing protein [Chitinophagales bacterium]
MRNILILGAGKSSIVLIDYLVEHAAEQQWEVTVADVSAEHALQKTKGRAATHAIGFDFNDAQGRRALLAKADIVISMLPAAMHITLAEDCLALSKNLVTPSYISDAMRGMDKAVKDKDLIFMNEMGLDPGIDHMSAMQMIDRLKKDGKVVTGFKSHCGGLIAPENDDNPWHYKFTWNPRNVILAGQGDGHIQYLEKGHKVKLTYEQLFGTTSELKLKGYGNFESYANRDSLKYIKEYGLLRAKTVYRGTLRRPPYCKGWNALIKMGFTNRAELETAKFKEDVAVLMKSKKIIADKQIERLVYASKVIPALSAYTDKKIVPADLLQKTLEQCWALGPDDKDMVVMVHELDYTDKSGKGKKTLEASLVCIGKDTERTAMATTVGLPVAMVTKMILNGEITKRGVLMPKYPEIYNPILAELEQYGIRFKETTK